MSRPRKANAPASVEVARDVTFTRFVADKIIFAEIGRDLEVSFLQYGPLHTRITDQGDHEGVVAKNVVTEVARMRTDYPTMVTAMMTFLREGLTGGRLKRDAVIDAIAEWGDEAATQESLAKAQA